MPAFEARAKDFEAAGTQVVGISTDSIYSHEAWARSLGGISYPLLGDIHREVVKKYGVYWPGPRRPPPGPPPGAGRRSRRAERTTKPRAVGSGRPGVRRVWAESGERG